MIVGCAEAANVFERAGATVNDCARVARCCLDHSPRWVHLFGNGGHAGALAYR